MNITTTGKIVFRGDAEILEEAIDYLEQLGEVDVDTDSSIVTLLLEENWDQDWEQNGIDMVTELHDNIPDVSILLIYTVFDHDSERTKTFECQYKNDCMKYRDTDWSYSGFVDNDITYDEFEEEGHMEIPEDMFDDYVHKKGKKNKNEYSDWEYIDL